jgi:hypothetical protein
MEHSGKITPHSTKNARVKVMNNPHPAKMYSRVAHRPIHKQITTMAARALKPRANDLLRVKCF